MIETQSKSKENMDSRSKVRGEKEGSGIKRWEEIGTMCGRGEHACTSSSFVLRERHLRPYERPFREDLFILLIDYLRFFDFRNFIFLSAQACFLIEKSTVGRQYDCNDNLAGDVREIEREKARDQRS